MSETDNEPTTTDDESPAQTIPRATFELYEDDAGEWRWRFVHRNGDTLADSAEGYASPDGALNGLDAVRALAPTARVERSSDD